MMENEGQLPLKPGDRFGDYTVEKLLGKGGMGAVYLVRALDGSCYAVKVMYQKNMTHDLRLRFAREADFAMNIHHKNLISVYDVGEDPETGLCYIIMDYVSGGTLSDRIKAHGRMPVDEAVKITLQVAAALDVAHRNGLVHRDIKPDNIMFDADGTPKLADLGVARFDDDDHKTMVTTTGMVIGTPAYMSPEQLMDSHNIDRRADIYSLGVVLYEMLTGKRPNEGSTAVELLAKAIKEEPLPDIREMRPEISAAVAHVLSLMCAPKPEDRPATSVEAGNLLYKAASGKLMLPKKPPRAVDVSRAHKSKLFFVAMAFVVIAVLCLILPWFVSHSSRNLQLSARPDPVVASSAYVQDGLVAMFDGIENVGRGKHDANAKTWKNLVGNVDAQPMGGEARWSDFAALFDGFFYYKVASIFGELQTVTIEVCHRANSPRVNHGGALFSSCENGGIGIQKDKRGHWIMTAARPGGWYYKEIYPGVTGEAETLSLAIADTLIGYRNAVEIGRFKGVDGIRYNKKYNYFQIGRDPGPSDDCINGEIYSIRLYSRALTSKEIVHNHEVDVRRFNLPKPGIAGLYHLEKGVYATQANGYTWFYRKEGDSAVLSRMMVGGEEMPCVFPRPTGKVVVPAELDGHEVKVIGQRAFASCEGMTEIVLPANLKEIRGWSSFYGCSGLSEVVLPGSLREIGLWTFEGCTSLKRVDLMNCSRSHSGFGCLFIGCRSLEEICCSPGNTVICSKDGALYSRAGDVLLAYPKTHAVLSLPHNVRGISQSALVSLNLKHIKIPEGIEFVKGNNFEHDDRGIVESVEFPRSLRRLGRFLFKQTKSIKRVIFHGDAPEIETPPFGWTSADFIVEVERGSKGWNGSGSTDLPERWPVGAGVDSRRIRYVAK